VITCPQCGSQNLPGMAYCENCGSPLPQQQGASVGSASAPAQETTAATADPTEYATTTTTTTTFAPASATASAAVDTTGGAPAHTPVDPAAVMLPQPVMPADLPPARTEVSVPSPVQTRSFGTGANAIAADAADAADAAPVQGASQGAGATAAPGETGTLNLVFPNGQSFVMQGDHAEVGRADVAQNWHPELDVIPFGGGAPDLGVSRHHARLERRDGGFAVIDVGSTNGTYINGRVAPYNQPVAIKDGDTLSFGALNTQLVVSS